MSRTFQRTAACAILALTICGALAGPASAARWTRAQRAPAQAQTQTRGTAGTAPGPLGMGNGYNSGNSGSGWNRNNSWYNIPQYGNYAPPPYATSKSAFIQVGPLPAFGGVRSLQGWGGAR
jgi:hypothetical protein